MKTRLIPSLFFCACLFSIQVRAGVPILNSYPGAQAVVYLDFDGHTVTGTSWNWNGPIYCGPSGLDPAAITDVFNRIAEDYRPFTINVTTDSTRFLNAPLAKRMRIIFTMSHEWYGNAGGVSMIGSFTWGDDTPAYVFTALLNYDSRKIGEAGSHETGHTLGLYHQVVYDANCVQVAEYNPGTGSGQTSWAPIMGVGYYRNMTVWHYGPNFMGCNTNQDELQLITSINGISFRNDDHSANYKQADNIRFSGSQFVEEGVIELGSDVDVFKLNLRSSSQVSISAEPFSLDPGNSGSNLDILVKLYDKKNELLGTYNPVDFLHASIDTFLNSGTYYISVEGAGNSFTPDYASIGAYTLSGNLGSASKNAFGTFAGTSEPESPQRPALVGNIVSGELKVYSPGNFRYVITNMQGAIFGKGIVTKGMNAVKLSLTGTGLYIIRFEDGTSFYSDKFMKQ